MPFALMPPEIIGVLLPMDFQESHNLSFGGAARQPEVTYSVVFLVCTSRVCIDIKVAHMSAMQTN
jgi:hypothetical protein